MWHMIWPVLVVVTANTVYNIAAKSTPADVNSFAYLAVSYAVGAVLSVVMFLLTSQNKNILSELSKINGTAIWLGVAIVALEFGYICIYRAGWKISVATLVANLSLACVLVMVGLLLYREAISVKQIIGIGLAAAGMMLIAQ